MALDTALRATLVDLEERFWLEGGGDPAYWDANFAADGLVALPTGILSKDETVAAMEQAQPWREVEMSDLHVRRLDTTSVLLAYRASATRDDGSGYAAVVTSVYGRHDGDWQLTVHQQSPLA